MIRVALDTNVIVAAMLSRTGASYEVLERLGPGSPFQASVSVPLVLEYEAALTRRLGRDDDKIEPVLDYLCEVAEQRDIYFLWRPFLRDPGDEMVLEVAVGARADAIVTHNVKDFHGVEELFGIRILTPGRLLLESEDPQ
jgi:putative PIN family toxin of toxin-antitoxin system